MAFELAGPIPRRVFTVLSEPMGGDAWHVTVAELPATWTVAFTFAEIERRARERIAIDLGVSRFDFDLTLTDEG